MLFAWLLGQRATLSMAILSGLFLLTMLYFEEKGWLPAPRSQTPVFLVACVLGTLMVATAVALLVRLNHQRQMRAAEAGDSTLRQQERQLHTLRLLIDQCPDSIVITDARRRIVYVNRAFEQQSGQSRQAVEGRHSAEVSTPGLKEDQQHAIDASLLRGGSWSGEQTLERPQGGRRIESIEIHPLRDGPENITHWFELKRDITERRWAAEQIDRLAYFDALTHLPNQAALRDDLDKCIGHPPASHLFLEIMLPSLSRINCAYGPQAGDDLIRQVGQRLRESLPASATAYRLHGARFGVLGPIPDRPRQSAQQAGLSLSRALSTALSGPWLLDLVDEPLRLDLRVGATAFAASENESAETVLHRACAALNPGPRDIDSGYHWFQERSITQARRAGQHERDWYRALEQSQLQLWLQPQFNALGATVGLCAEPHWLHPLRGKLTPSEFIPLLRQSEGLRQLDLWTLEQLEPWLRRAMPRPGGLNLSFKLFSQPDEGSAATERLLRATPELVQGAWQAVLPCQRFEPDPQQGTPLAHWLNLLKAEGLKVSLHGFGFGHPGVLDLDALELRGLHLDPRLLGGPEVNQAAPVWLSTVLDICRRRALRVIADGVVNGQQHRRLCARHPDLICQGPLQPAHRLDAQDGGPGLAGQSIG